MIVHRRFHEVRVARGQLKPVVGLLVPHESGIRLEGCFAFPLSDTLTFGVFQKSQHCTLVESCFVAILLASSS